MKDLIIEHIERRARLDHGGDVNKAAAEYFRDYPEEWKRYREEATGVNKRAGEDREKVNTEVHYRIEHIAYRDHLDLQKLADLVAAQTKLFAEDLDLYKRYAAANTVRVGKVSMTD
jgi:hypothetical protein